MAKVKNGEGEAVKAVSTATGREPAKAAEKCPTGGRGSNTESELQALWGLLWLARRKYINQLQVLNDSRVIIKWVGGSFNLNILELEHWKSQIGLLKTQFDYISFFHIFRHLNSVDDSYSKKVVYIPSSALFIEE